MDSKFISALSKHTNQTGQIHGNQNIKYKSSENKTNNDDFEESIVNKNSDDYKFDCFVEKLQEIVIEDEFEHLQNDFCEKYYKILHFSAFLGKNGRFWALFRLFSSFFELGAVFAIYYANNFWDVGK